MFGMSKRPRHAGSPDSDECGVAGQGEDGSEGSESQQMEDSVRSLFERLDWYRKTARRSLVVATLSMLTSVLFALLAIGLVVFGPSPVYFAVTKDFRTKQLTPLDQPTMSESGMMNWATQALTETLSLDFVHYKQQLIRARPHYLPSAFSSLLQSLKEGGNLSYIAENRLSVKAVAPHAPVLLNTGIVEGRKAYKMQVPINLSYESSEGTPTTQSLVATIVVQRVSARKYPDTVAIAQVLLKHNNGDF